MFHLTWSGNAKMENVRFAISVVNISSGYHLTKFLIYFLGLFGIFLMIQLCQIHNQKVALWDAMLSRCTFAFLYWTPLTRPFLAFASASKRLFAWNHSYENVFRLQVHFKVKQLFSSWKVSQDDLFWNGERGQLGNGQLTYWSHQRVVKKDVKWRYHKNDTVDEQDQISALGLRLIKWNNQPSNNFKLTLSLMKRNITC